MGGHDGRPGARGHDPPDPAHLDRWSTWDLDGVAFDLRPVHAPPTPWMFAAVWLAVVTVMGTMAVPAVDVLGWMVVGVLVAALAVMAAVPPLVAWGFVERGSRARVVGRTLVIERQRGWSTPTTTVQLAEVEAVAAGKRDVVIHCRSGGEVRIPLGGRSRKTREALAQRLRHIAWSMPDTGSEADVPAALRAVAPVPEG